MLDDAEQVLGPFPQSHLVEWHESGAIHGEREVCCEANDKWMLLKTMVFQSKRKQAHGTGAQPSASGGNWKDGLVGGRRSALELGPMYASNVAYGSGR